MSHAERGKQIGDLAGAVAEAVDVHADFVEEREVQIGERHGLVVADVSIAFHPACRAPGDEDRQVGVIVHVGVSNAATVEQQRVIQERAVALGRGLQAL